MLYTDGLTESTRDYVVGEQLLARALALEGLASSPYRSFRTIPLSERGRGLFIVNALVDDFHIKPSGNGGSHARAVLRVPRYDARRERTPAK